MRFIHISDVYLGYAPDAGCEWSDDRKKEIRDTFLQILKDCNEKNVQLLLIAGNLFHEVPDEEELKWLDEQLLTLEHTRTLLLAGFTDPMTKGSPLEGFSFASKTVVFPAGRTTNAYLKGVNTCVTGFSYRKPEETTGILEGINPGRAGSFNILLACGGTPEHMPFRKNVIAAKGFDYVALGGSRKPQHLLKNRMAYSGSPEPLGPEDAGKHGYILGEMTEEGTTVTWCPVAKRSYVRLTFDMKQQYEEVDLPKMAEERMLKLGHENIYSIVLRGTVDQPLRQDFSRLNRRFHVISVQDMTVPERELERFVSENRGNLIGDFDEYLKTGGGALSNKTGGALSSEDKLREKARRYGLEALTRAGD